MRAGRAGVGRPGAALPRRAAALALAAAVALTAEAAAAVAVWPPELHIASRPGEEAAAEVRILNGSPVPQEVAIALTDWEAEGGRRVAVPAGTGSRSLAPFMVGGLPPRLLLQPGEAVSLAVTVRRPPGDGGTRWLGVAVMSHLHGAAPPAAGVPRLLRRQTVRIYHTPLPLTPVQGSIVALTTPRDPARDGMWTVDYVNPTDRVVKVQGEWRLSDGRGQEAARGPLGPFLAYPGRRSVPFGPLPALAPGTYHLLVLATPEGGETAAGNCADRVRGEEGPIRP